MAFWLRLSIMLLILLVVWGWGTAGSLESRAADQSSPAGNSRSTRFTKADNGVITDSVTGLEWYVGPNRDNDWHQAKAWTENLTVAGGGWRLPTVPELKALYQHGAARNNMDPLFQTPGVWVWSGQLKDPSFAWGFAFYNGLEGWHHVNYGYGRQVMAVRSPK